MSLFQLLLAVVLHVTIIAVHSDSDAIVTQYCEILRQLPRHISLCLRKVDSYRLSGERPPIMLLCCLGYFRDVTTSYMHFLSPDFINFIAELTNQTHIINIANFVIMCKNDTYVLTRADFMFWGANGKVWSVCKMN